MNTRYHFGTRNVHANMVVIALVSFVVFFQYHEQDISNNFTENLSAFSGALTLHEQEMYRTLDINNEFLSP